MNTKAAEKTNAIAEQERQEVLSWLMEQKFPALPVAERQPAGTYPLLNKASGKPELDKDGNPKPRFTGKNPSYLDKKGIPHLVNHRVYQKRLPTEQELDEWFANGANGIGTLGGWKNTIWLDFDTKQFSSQDECDTAVLGVCDSIKAQTEQEPFLERSHSGGWHIGVRVNQKPDFTNFTLSEGGKHVGEALGEGRFVVLAPTVGPSGSPYESINRCDLPVVESLENIGIYPTSKGGKNINKTTSQEQIIWEGYVPNAIPLESLGSELSRQILNGACPSGDRSQSLTTALKEWLGWENWARANNVSYSGTTEQLAEYAGGKLGIDADRIGRILKTIDPEQCHPAALSKGSEDSCWKKVRRLSKETFESQCPADIKEHVIKSEWKQSISNSVKGGDRTMKNTTVTSDSRIDGDSHDADPISIEDTVTRVTEVLKKGFPEWLELNKLEAIRVKSELSHKPAFYALVNGLKCAVSQSKG